VNSLFNYPYYSRAQIDGQLSALRRTGATVARSDALWEAAELGPPLGGVHHYDWRFDDNIAASLSAHGLKWLPIVDYTASWAASVASQEHSPPRSDADFAAFAAALTARYRAGGAFWRGHPELAAQPVDTFEIWNEPDVAPFWVPDPDAARYAELYATARAAVTRVDPNARVIIGGLGHLGSFLPAMLVAHPALLGHIDGVGMHPYASTPTKVLSAVATARAVMRRLGLGGVPLYVTEVGWSTSPPGDPKWAPERLRPAYIERTFATFGHTDCGIAAAILYSWMTPERAPTIVDDWFGISPPTGGSTADTEAFAAGLRAAGQAAGTINLCS
jgi:hypothetical protein